MEEILVVKRDKLLSRVTLLTGFHRDNIDKLLQNIHRFGYFINRSEAENDPSLKQIIPYLLITHQSNDIFMVQRLSTQIEKRLHNKYSIGIGGHINPVRDKSSQLDDRDSEINSNERKNISNGVNPVRNKTLPVSDVIKSGLERELHEELNLSTDYQYTLVGYLNDDTNSVGQVHLGLVYQVMVDDITGVEVAEKGLMTGRFVSPTEIEQHYALLESWSQMVYKDFIKKRLGFSCPR
jgi:predicted NUDIX family phosphoesterase